MHNKTIRAVGATVILCGVAVAAMSQIGPGEPSALEIDPPSALPTSSRVQPSMATTTPAEPFEYRVGLLAGVTTDNFWAFVGDQPTVWNAYVLGPTKPGLYGVDPLDNTLIPDAASAPAPQPTRSGSGWQVTVALSDGLTWSDGTPLTALDVAYTFDTVRRLHLGGGWADAFPPAVKSITATSEHDLRIDFASQPSLQVWPYGIGLAPIMPRHVWESQTTPLKDADDLYAKPGEADVSGGPLQLVTVGEDRVESQSSPGHGGGGPDRVTYIVYPDEGSAVAALGRGEIDNLLNPNGISPESVAALDNATDVAIESSPANAVRYLGFNLDREPMSDPSFRQALALLLDRQNATETVVPDGTAAYTLISPANRSWFDPDAAAAITTRYELAPHHRLRAAIELLTASGYRWESPPRAEGSALSPGTGLTIDGQAPGPVTIVTPGDEYDAARPDYTQRIVEALEVLGFTASAVVTDFDTVVDLAFTTDADGVRQYDMYVLGWTLGNPALPDFFGRFFSADGEFNSTGYESAEFEAGMERYQEATDFANAKTALWEMERILADDLPYLVLYHPDIVEAYRSDRVGFDAGPVLGGIQGRLGGIGDLIPAS